MLFGRKELFAIECEVEIPLTSFFNCNICFWINEKKLGNFERGGTLYQILGQFEYVQKSNRSDPSFEGKSAKEIFDAVFQARYNYDDKYSSLNELNTQYHKYDAFDICENIPAFDFKKLLLINDGNNQRFLWWDKDLKSLEEYVLPALSCEKIMTQFLDWGNVVFTNETPLLNI